MRILQLCKKFPYPAKDGEAIAILNLTKGFSAAGMDVTVLCLNTKKHYFDLNQLPIEYQRMASFYAVDVNTDVNWWDAFLNLFFSQKSYHIERFVSDEFAQRLKELLQSNSFDVIQLEGLYLFPYLSLIREYSGALVSFRAHNVEHEIWFRLTEQSDGVFRKNYLRMLANRMRKFEVKHADEADVIVPISMKDAEWLKQHSQKPAFVSPASVDLALIDCHAKDVNRNSLFFIGGMDWLPNLDAVNWFLTEIWPRLNSIETLQFHLAGRNFDAEKLRNVDKRVKLHGEVPDAYQFMCDKQIMVVPLQSGSGMRIKIIEAMAMGKVVISTTLGAEGVAYSPGINILIADSVDDFLEKIRFCLSNPDIVDRISDEARKLAAQYDHLKLSKDLLNFYLKQSN